MSYETEVKYRCIKRSPDGRKVKFNVAMAGIAGDPYKLIIGDYKGIKMSYLYDAGSIFSPIYRNLAIRKIMSAFDLLHNR